MSLCLLSFSQRTDLYFRSEQLRWGRDMGALCLNRVRCLYLRREGKISTLLYLEICRCGGEIPCQDIQPLKRSKL